MLKIEVIFLETSFATVSAETSKDDWICACGCKLFTIKQSNKCVNTVCSNCSKSTSVYLATRKITHLKLTQGKEE